MNSFCLSEQETKIIKYLVYSTNGLSIFGAIMVLITYIIVPKLRRNWLMRYLAYLNISNLFYGALQILMFLAISTNTIQTQSITFINLVLSCCTYSSSIWPLILAINLYQIVAKRNNNLSTYEFIYLFFGFIIPIIIVFILNCFGLIQLKNPVFGIIDYLIPLILIIIFSLLTYIKLIRASIFALEEEETKKVIKIIIPYPLVTIVASLSMCSFIIVFSPNECFTLLSGILLSIRCLQGALDAIVFSFNPTVKEEMRKHFIKNNEMNDSIL